ncbi:MAG: MarR family winged helix-turn-helix transcriptional regulator [Microbacteriaceae bacterium]
MQTQHSDRGRMNVHPATTLVREIIDVTTEFERHVARQLTVNITDLNAMEHLIQSGPLSPTELAKRLDISTAAVTSVIDRLTNVGHVTREPQPNDRRGVLVVPQPASVAKAMSTLMPMILGINEVLDGFDDSEKATITEYLQRVVDTYRAQLGTDEP